MPQRALRLVLPVLVLAGLATWIVQTQRQPDAPPLPTPPTIPSGGSTAPLETSFSGPIELLEGLAVGNPVEDWLVDRLFIEEAPNKTPALAIDLARNGDKLTIWVHRKGAFAKAAVETERYALSYGHARTDGGAIGNDVFQKLMTNIANRIRRTEKRAAVPEGL